MNSGRVLFWRAVRLHGLALLTIFIGFASAQGQAATTPASDSRDWTFIATVTSEDPTVFLEEFSQKALEMLADGTLSADQRRDALQQFFRLGFDLEAISRFVLGRHWRIASESERSEFKALFEAFIVGFYADKFDNYSGETLKLGSSRQIDDETTSVKSKIIRPGGAAIRVDWRLRRIDQSWQIVDVVVEGVSLSIVQRSEFDSVIRNNGGRVESLLAVLREMAR